MRSGASPLASGTQSAFAIHQVDDLQNSGSCLVLRASLIESVLEEIESVNNVGWLGELNRVGLPCFNAHRASAIVVHCVNAITGELSKSNPGAVQLLEHPVSPSLEDSLSLSLQ